MRFALDKALTLTECMGTPQCHAYRERIFRAHESLCLPLAKQYCRTEKAKGYVVANLELGELHKRLTLGPKYQGLFIDSPDEDVKAFSEQRSLEIYGIGRFWIKNRGFKRAAEVIARKLEECNIQFPHPDWRNADNKALAGAIARTGCAAWWRRQIRHLQGEVVEHVLIELGLVNLRAGIYTSNHSVKRKLAQWHRNNELLAAMEAENDLGQVFNLLELAQRGMANLQNRRNELMVRINGFQEIALEKGHKAIFYTITAPSRFHAYRSKPFHRNPNYQDASPKDTQAYFNTVWARIRASLKRQKIEIYGIRVVEPHHDGTPHWHLLLFVAQEQTKALTDTLWRYALEDSPDEPGARKRRVKVEHIDPDKGSAVAYVAKYVAKNIDGENVGADFYGRDAVESATRIRAWASIWGIRQFQFIGGPSVTAWREARRMITTEEGQAQLERLGDDYVNALLSAADRGDWKAFVALSGGPTALRKDQPLRAYHVAKERPNRYGEVAKQLMGLLFEGIKHLRTRFRAWTIRTAQKITEALDFNEGFSIGGANAPPLEFCQ